MSPAKLGVLLVLGLSGGVLTAQEQDLVAALKKTTADLAAADKTVAAAKTALIAAREALETTRFNSAAYNARVSAQQLAAAKEKYEKAAPEAKGDALEAYELSQELDAQRKPALDAAQNLLPQREAEARVAEEKYAAVLAAAEAAGERIRVAVRQSESEAQLKLKDSKLAIEKAAFSKATAEQMAATNAAIVKAMSEMGVAEKALQQASQAVKQASEADRPRKATEAEKAAKAYLAALHAAVRLLPSFEADKTKAATLKGLRVSFFETDAVLQAAAAAHQQAKQSLDEKTKAVKQTEERIKAAKDGMEKRIAKIRAQKDLAREEEALQRARTALNEAAQVLPVKVAEMEKAQQAHAAALQAVVKALVLVPEPEKALAEDRAALARAVAERAAGIKEENGALGRDAAESEKAAAKAKVDLAAAEKTLSERVAVREALLKVMRQRFLRDVRFAQDDQTRHEMALANANRELQPKARAFDRAGETLKQAKDALAKARKDSSDAAAAAAAAAKDRLAAEKSAGELAAAKSAAERKAADTLAAAKAAKEVLPKTAALAGETRAGAERLAKDLETAAQTAAKLSKDAGDAAKLASAALDKKTAALKAVEKGASNLAAAIKGAEQKVAAAQTALDTATAEKVAAERVADGHRRGAQEAAIRLAIGKAGAQGGLKSLAASAWDRAKARHLMTRAGFGGTPGEVDKLHALGLHGAVAFLVNFKNQPPPQVAFAAHPKEQPANYESVLHGDDQRRMREQRVATDRRQLQDMRAWWLRRMIESSRPLEEKLTLFWHGQIPVQYTTVGDSYYMYLQNELFREHAAGNFAALLHGIAHDAAMLKYLNNDTNVKGRANENLAREIMELFSMGRDQGYSEIDIRQGARALTGYTYDAATGQFRFISDRHDTDPKTILGKTGNYCGDDFVRLILETPYPAKFIARQLFTFFVHSEPSLDTIEALANVLRLNNYEMAPMLENLFLSEEFYGAKAVNNEIKSPVQLIVGLHRDLGLTNPDYTYLAAALRDMGQELFEPPSVFGWQGQRTWVTTSRILGRYNVLAEILERRPRDGKAGVDVVGTLLAGKTFKNHAEVADYLVTCLWRVTLSASKRQAVLEFLKPLPDPAQWTANPGPVNARLTRLLVMLACAPEFQLG